MRKYPLPSKNSNPTKAEWDDSVELGNGFMEFHDGRPAKVETWGEDGYTFNTYFFSTIDIENLSFEELMNYMRAQGIPLEADIQEDFVGLGKWIDGNGNELWSVTIVVGEDDGPNVIDDDWYLRKYGCTREEFLAQVRGTARRE